MTTRAVEQFDEWESSPFRDGYRGLHDLADSSFSGVVEVGHAKLCMLNGTAVGILEGDIDDFDGASGTAYEAPSPALPLLALMQERSEEVRGKYYSEDTPLSEVDDTLADGGFTGFIELSENVLSGDYYVVYHRGRSMAVAWVGNSGQLLTDDEAFERADDEVGIFAVHPAELDPVELPEVDDGTDATGGDDADDTDTAAAAGGAAVGGAAAVDDADPDAATDPDPAAAEDGAAGSESDGVARTEPEDAARAAESDPADPEPSDSDSAAESGSADADRAADETTPRTAEAADEPTRDSSVVTDDGPDEGAANAAGGDSVDDPAAAGTGGGSAERPAADGREGGDRGDRTDRSDDRPSVGERERADRTRERSATDADRGDGADGRAADREGREPTESRPSDARSSGSSRDAVRDRAATDSPDRTHDTSRAEESRAVDRSADSAGSAGAARSPDQLETHSIPSLDPSRTTTRESDDGTTAASDDQAGGGSAGVGAAAASAVEDRTDGSASVAREPDDRGSGRAEDRDQRVPASASETHSESEPTEPRTTEAVPADSRASEPGPARADERVADLEDELAERESEIDRLEADLAAAESERDDLRSQLEEVRAERDDLRSRVERVETDRDQLERERNGLESEVADLQSEIEQLEGQLAEIEEEFGAAVDAEQRLSPGEALDQTNLFVRYESKGKATLETAHAGEASRQEVGENLGLEYHTQFDSATASVGGRPFDEFLRDTMQFRFVTWVINDLLYEIRDTGKVSALQDLYDAIPQIDRAELNGSVSTEYTEDGQERRSQESFDVVMRDRMGNALLTANMNDSRQAASESMMSALVTASSHVGESTESLGASLLVTSSFFEPEALETAADATSGGLLSRDKRESFVKLTRKQGYHLCLVEAREEKFHLAVPEL
ncbi:hypothetical protein I7X12_04295 [Halosimplex litoreum]|uniref:DUF7527 domain-containing protein n=1 Tax=Halosimplex litoreum TaxID=1198301 RepID=A0A7T3G018_9EURY|nr:hypothetical protein [Halosimplex litoreum]QPV63858.1 hypothetical protein I7X12_04295 [Halosimplex litoreum]